MTEKTECMVYNEVGDCIEWKVKPEGIYGKVKKNAELCNPKLAKEARESLNKGKFFVINEPEI